MYEKNLEYWDNQAMSENPSYGSRNQPDKHGYLSSYSKRFSIKRFLDRNPEKQDCFRRRHNFTPGKKNPNDDHSVNVTNNSGDDTLNSNGVNKELSFKSPNVKDRIEKVKARRDGLNTTMTSSLLSENYKETTNKSLLKDDVIDFQNKYAVLDVMKKRLLSHDHVKEFVTKVIEENDVDTMQILIKDPKTRNMMIESLGELVLIKMMSDAHEKFNAPSSSMINNPPHRSRTPHKSPFNKVYIPKELMKKEPEHEKIHAGKSQTPSKKDLVGSLRNEYMKRVFADREHS
ncbi:hypothetical protein AKO1_004643 [Acrasis kona]|uniref:Uncharacterized protein n=1 Tax=Acrasis kona TaxID=1008807 RepID=A0AAW2Z3U3_9EUKA